MFRIRKVWLIPSFTVLALLASLTLSSFAFEYDGIHWADADLPVTWEMNQDGTADCTGEFDAVRAGYRHGRMLAVATSPRHIWEPLRLEQA